MTPTDGPYRPTLIAPEALPELASALGWELEDGRLVRVVHRGDFAGALALVNEIGAVAERLGHHPDIEISWDTVTLRLSTHSAGGVTDYDEALARAIEALLEA